MITKEEAHSIAAEVVRECRIDVDKELLKLHQADHENAWTEEKARAIAKEAARFAAGEAADLAVQKIYNDVYLSVGKKTVAVIGATVVASLMLINDFVREVVSKWIGLK